MKISKLTNGLLVSLLLTATVAEADSKYPATDFQPKVVYQDTDYKHSGTAPSSTSSSTAKSSAEVSVADPNYPAANFQPEVLFKDESYKHKEDKASVSSSSVNKSVVSSSNNDYQSSGESGNAASEDSSLSLVLGLGVLAVAGFVFYTNNTKKKVPAKRRVARSSVASASASSDSSVSGVAKYLESKVGAKPSGVAKYLEERNTSVSSVSKYVAKQKISARVASVTGVEKYLKDRG